MSAGGADANREHLDHIAGRNLGQFPGIGGSPKEKGVDDAHAELKARERHREASRTAGSFKSKLVL